MTRLPRKQAIGLDALIEQYLDQSGLRAGVETQRIFSAWDQASGAAKYTIKKFYRAGKLYITVDSSVVRSQLLFQKDALIEKICAITKSDSVKELILK